jgi:membrane-anchored glycerophosphoryl diester phosphodiesterase (GDPDase)
MLILAPLFLLAGVYGIWMSLRYSLAVPACVVEDLPASGAIKRSIELSQGSRGRIFVLGLLVYAVRMLLGILFGFPMIALAVKHPGQPLPLGWMVLAQIGGFVTSTLIGPIYSTGLTLFYYDQRIRKEGFDIEWMMQAAGLSPQPELPAPQNS